MSEPELHRPSRRFSITEQYGLVGWLALATVVVAVTALTLLVATSVNMARASSHRSTTRSADAGCNAVGDASGAMDAVALFDDALRQTSLCR
jgi:hypothetical protein